MKKKQILRIADILAEAIQDIAFGGAGRLGTPGLCINFLDTLDEDEKVFACCSMATICRAEDAAGWMDELEDAEIPQALASVMVFSELKDRIVDLLKSGFNPSMLWDEDRLIPALMGAGHKLSDLLSGEEMPDAEGDDGDDGEWACPLCGGIH